jgi:hypothetical protein
LIFYILKLIQEGGYILARLIIDTRRGMGRKVYHRNEFGRYIGEVS